MFFIFKDFFYGANLKSCPFIKFLRKLRNWNGNFTSLEAYILKFFSQRKSSTQNLIQLSPERFIEKENMVLKSFHTKPWAGKNSKPIRWALNRNETKKLDFFSIFVNFRFSIFCLQCKASRKMQGSFYYPIFWLNLFYIIGNKLSPLKYLWTLEANLFSLRVSE